MAISTYSELQAAVADTLHRSDLTVQIPNFINLAECAINRRLNIYSKEVEADIASVIGSRFVSLPTDYSSPIALWSNYVSPREEIVFTTPEQLPVDENVSTLPQYWAIDGANIAFDVMADQVYSLTFRYVQSVFLSDLQTTIPIFAKNPDLYLYGALAHSAHYTRDDPRLVTWKNEYASILREVAAEASRSKGMANLATDIPAILPSNFPLRRRY